MIRLSTLTSLASLVALVAGAVAIADDAPVLVHNPFSRPPSQVVRPPSTIITTDDGSRWSLALLATLVGPSQRYADVAGRIMKPGDEVDGYRLLEVQEDNATFVKDGRRFTVNVRPDETEQIDE